MVLCATCIQVSCIKFLVRGTVCHRLKIVVNIWNRLPTDVITATSVNSFWNRLDLFRADQEVLYNYKANITENRGIKTAVTFYLTI